MPYAVAVAAIAAGGAAYQSDQAKSASNEQAGAANRAGDVQRQQFTQTRADNAPFLQTGTAANARLSQLLGLPGSEDAATNLWLRQNVEPQIRAQMAAAGQPLAADWKPDATSLAEWKQAYFPNGVPDDISGASSNGSLMKRFSSSDLAADPVYNSGLQFGQEEGEKAINARATQAGNYDSGATLKALTRFGNDYGSTKANESYNRYTNDQNNTFNRLSGISGTGQVATNQVASAGSAAAGQIGASIEGAGNARAAGIVGGANAWGNAGASANNSINNYQNSQLLQKLLAQNQGGSQTPYFQYSGYDSGGGSAYG